MLFSGFRRRRRPVPASRPDPAFSVFAQLAALIAFLFGRLPLVPGTVPLFPATDRERGEGGQVPMPSRRPSHGRYRTRPTYRQLVADLRRPAARAEAADVLRRRVPAEVLPWLDHVIAREDWWALGTVARAGVPDGTVEIRMMQETLAWLRRQQPEGGEVPDADATLDPRIRIR